MVMALPIFDLSTGWCCLRAERTGGNLSLERERTRRSSTAPLFLQFSLQIVHLLFVQTFKIHSNNQNSTAKHPKPSKNPLSMSRGKLLIIWGYSNLIFQKVPQQSSLEFSPLSDDINIFQELCFLEVEIDLWLRQTMFPLGLANESKQSTVFMNLSRHSC